jgi:anhydro-N-acetylmuramic acid kinase
MSGSSLDAIDAALVRFDGGPELIAHHTHPLPAALVTQIDALTRPGDDELKRLAIAEVELGNCFADAVLALLDQAGVAAAAVRAIGSHGQTVRHEPHPPHRHSLQIGDPNLIAERTGISTVADFRRRDMAAGGQGAPLVPAFHQAMLHDPAQDRVVLNIGGIANLTLLPAAIDAPVLGFDTGPGNALLDAWIQQQQGKPYDEGGSWAASGRLQPDLLTMLLGEAYFHETPPKSTGRDYFNLDWLARCWPDLSALRPADVQATLLELTAFTIGDAIRRFAAQSREVLVCGGGLHNSRLMQRLQELLPEQTLISTASYGLDPDWMEAMAFAWLARQTLQHRPGNLPSVTGARHPVILGGIYPA